MNILLTNDDGIESPGIWAAARALATMGHVLVVAPATNYSGYGMALPPRKELVYNAYDRRPADLPDVTAFSVPAPPAVCVQVGLSGALGRKWIDLVVSGINDSCNVGRDLLYSGTVGAALTAHLQGVPAIAVSLDAGLSGMAHWETAGWALQETVRNWRAPDASPLILNLNVPNRPIAGVVGVQATYLSSVSCLDQYQISAGAGNSLHLRPKSDRLPAATEPGSDAWALTHGYISLTPLRLFHDILRVAPPGELWSIPAPVSAQYAFA